MERIFTAGWQGRKVRLVHWMALGMTPVASWAGWVIARTYGVRPADGGVLAPLGVRLAFGGSVAALGLLFLAGMWVYGRCYVLETFVDEERGQLAFVLAGLTGRWRMEVPVDAVESSTGHAGRTSAGGFTVNAPWISVRLRGRRLPLIIDVQGEFIRRELIVQYLLRAHRRRRGTVPSR